MRSTRRGLDCEEAAWWRRRWRGEDSEEDEKMVGRGTKCDMSEKRHGTRGKREEGVEEMRSGKEG